MYAVILFNRQHLINIAMFTTRSQMHQFWYGSFCCNAKIYIILNTAYLHLLNLDKAYLYVISSYKADTLSTTSPLRIIQTSSWCLVPSIECEYPIWDCQGKTGRWYSCLLIVSNPVFVCTETYSCFGVTGLQFYKEWGRRLWTHSYNWIRFMDFIGYFEF